MNLSIYIHKILYKHGGTECFTAKLASTLQSILPSATITLLTEHYKGTSYTDINAFITDTLNTYGVKITPNNFLLSYIEVKEVVINDNKNIPIIKRMQRKWQSHRLQKGIIKTTRGQDLFINAAGSIYVGRAKINVIVNHFPIRKMQNSISGKKNPLLRFMASRQDALFSTMYDCYLPNSLFTKTAFMREWSSIPQEKIKLIYHSVEPIIAKEDKEPNSIICVGRIERSKKIEVMINAFNSSSLKENCKLTIAGSIDTNDPGYIDALTKLKSKNITFITNLSHEDLAKVYSKGLIFWHAKGYNEEDEMQMEHFGMATVEAMSAGCIPVVINKGGQKEIVNETCGYKWNDTEELINYTKLLINDPARCKVLSENAKKRALFYSKEAFTSSIKSFIDTLHLSEK